jgi:threonyl-tRNA synthetase
VIHRALFGSIERFLAILIEHYAGNLPTWLSPVQAAVLPVRDDHRPYAEKVGQRLVGRGLRVVTEGAEEPLNARIRRHRLERVPYVLVVGDEDVDAGTVGVNVRGEARPERGVPVDEVVTRITDDVEGRRAQPQRPGAAAAPT